MLLREKALYHQIHPLKLAVDILSEPISLYFLWQHELALGLISHFVPPVLTSALMISLGSFEAQKRSLLGRYVQSHMTRTVEAVRFAGDMVMVFSAWFREPFVIAAGLLIVVAAWLSGLVWSRASA